MANTDPNKKVEQILSGLSPAQLQKGLETFGKLAKGKDAAKLKAQMNNLDTQKVMEMFNSMDTNAIKSKLNNLDLDKVSLNDLDKNPDVLDRLKKK